MREKSRNKKSLLRIFCITIVHYRDTKSSFAKINTRKYFRNFFKIKKLEVSFSLYRDLYLYYFMNLKLY